MSSVQFRSRIKPAFDYSDTLNSYGVCCGQTGSNNKTIRSFTECFNEGGHFIPVPDGNYASVQCPDADTRLGCCCACSYVTPGQLNQIPTLTVDGNVVAGSSPYLASGFRTNVSRCECERLGGKWNSTPCPDTLSDNNTSDNYWKTYCLKPDSKDARTPRSCCHLNFDETTGWPTGIECEDVCTSADCAALGTQTYPSQFGTNTRCQIPIVQGQSPTTATCDDPVFLSLISSRSTVYQNFVIGSCYTFTEQNGSLEYTCAITPEALCEGYWVEEQDQNTPYCVTGYQPSNPQRIAGVYQPQTMTTAAFNAIGITNGDIFQGGVFIGIYQPPYLNGTNSQVYGNLSFGTPTLGSVSPDPVGGTNPKWAIIVDSNKYAAPFLNSSELDLDYDTSLWDGYYNTYGSSTFGGIQTALTNTIKFTDRNGFIDYYIPSIYELYFYSAYLLRNNITSIGNVMTSSMFNTKYLNQQVQQTRIAGNGHIYGVSINSLNDVNFKTILINKRNIETALFFRRIILT
jgi:hypothetical protein